ncbi:MAG TPA: tyrosine-type recombinase/integrase [Terriglobales bacterium]
MNGSLFHSVLAEPLANFVQYKQALNRKYRTETGTLRLFDRYLSERRIAGWESIDNVLIDDFLKSRRRTRPRSYNHLIGVIRRFFAWAVVQELIPRNPVMAPLRRETAEQIRYLFNLSDAKRLLELVRTLADRPQAPRRALVYETVFALLYGLGLRVGEVIRLKLGEVDFRQDTLFIRETKFGKSRIVPLGPKLAARLRRYVEQRYGEKREPETPLFCFTKRGSLSPNTVTQTFHKLLPQLNLPIPPGVYPPRLHDLRRSFAVATLLRWYREGIDPRSRLLHLATFMGHVNAESTAVYLPITEDLLREADRRFRAAAPKAGVQ